MADIPLPGIFLHIKEITAGIGPIKVVFIAVNLKILIQPSNIYLNIAVIKVICKIHKMIKRGYILPGYAGFLKKLPVCGVNALFAFLYFSAYKV